MQKRLLLTGILALAGLSIIGAQDYSSCDGERYRQDVFDAVDITAAIQFGSNTTIGGNAQNLFMDVYEPAGDTAQVRPTVVMAFGGAFVAGQREDLDDLCRTLARKGYVSVTIDYRLFDQFIPLDSNQMHDVVVKAIGDMKAAIRYLREDAATSNQFRVDTNLIFAGGISAGAITAAHVAHLDETDDIPNYLQNIIANNGGIEGNSSNNYQYSSDVAGLVNYSGALKDARFIDANDPPQLSVHDEGDGIVVYGNGVVFAGPIVVVYLEGSYSMDQQAQAVGVESRLITYPGNGHVSYFTNNADQYQAEVETATADFLADQICGEISGTQALRPALSARAYPNPLPRNQPLRIRVEGYNGPLQLQIFGMSGAPVAQQALSGGREEALSLPPLPAGVYILELRAAGNQLAPVRHRIVIQ
ncbi:MAG: alpha/beta hydrolase fold domain-containing protein [Phaeodactylibacter sp.]|uniref:alpha/beta hydrolase fold domain-containing protein n=1 Tax=Phaeodactylibacter sp. TaxID=1940289 RepID=UPI0032EF2B11